MVVKGEKFLRQSSESIVVVVVVGRILLHLVRHCLPLPLLFVGCRSRFPVVGVEALAVPGESPPAPRLESRRAFVCSAMSKGASCGVVAAAMSAAAGVVGSRSALASPTHPLGVTNASESPRSRPATSAAIAETTGLDQGQSTEEANRGANDGHAAAFPPTTFKTRAYGQAEYTNAITASRDTNISPKEAYDVIRERIPANVRGDGGRALDVGAGAGLSTAVLYVERGYMTIDAVDWSGKAWSENVVEPLPSTVRWYEADDDQFLSTVAAPKSYHVIVYNFAINMDKAYRVARRYLVESSDNADGDSGGGGLLLAPVNDRADYWYKQSYLLLNANGDVLWRSEPEVGAWSVQFQPDVTSETCTGIWCGGYNGYQQKRRTM
jgi:hypothetical protein